MWGPVLWMFSGGVIFLLGMLVGMSIAIGIKNAQTGGEDG